MNPVEILGATLTACLLVGAIYGGARTIASAHARAVRENQLIQRIAQWFPDEHPNGEVSLPTQVKNLHACLDRLSKRLSKVEQHLGK